MMYKKFFLYLFSMIMIGITRDAFAAPPYPLDLSIINNSGTQATLLFQCSTASGWSSYSIPIPPSGPSAIPLNTSISITNDTSNIDSMTNPNNPQPISTTGLASGSIFRWMIPNPNNPSQNIISPGIYYDTSACDATKSFSLFQIGSTTYHPECVLTQLDDAGNTFELIANPNTTSDLCPYVLRKQQGIGPQSTNVTNASITPNQFNVTNTLNILGGGTQPVQLTYICPDGNSITLNSNYIQPGSTIQTSFPRYENTTSYMYCLYNVAQLNSNNFKVTYGNNNTPVTIQNYPLATDGPSVTYQVVQDQVSTSPTYGNALFQLVPPATSAAAATTSSSQSTGSFIVVNNIDTPGNLISPGDIRFLCNGQYTYVPSAAPYIGLGTVAQINFPSCGTGTASFDGVVLTYYNGSVPVQLIDTPTPSTTGNTVFQLYRTLVNNGWTYYFQKVTDFSTFSSSIQQQINALINPPCGPGTYSSTGNAPCTSCGKGATSAPDFKSCTCTDSANATWSSTTNNCSCNDTKAWLSKTTNLCACKVGFTGTPGSCSSIFQSAATLTAANSASPSISQQIATAITNLTPAAGATPTTGQTNALAYAIATSIQYQAYNQCLTLYPMPQTTAQATSYSACITSANTAIAPYSTANIVTALSANPITAAAISTYTTTANTAVSAAMPSAPAVQCGKGATLLAGATSCSCIDSANATWSSTTNNCSCNDTKAWLSKTTNLCACKVGFTGTPGSCSSIFQSAATLAAANSASPSISQQIATAITNLTPAAGATPTTGQTNALAYAIATSIQYQAYNQCLTLYPMPQTTAQATSYSACITSANTAIAPYSTANIVTALSANPITAAAISTYTTTANTAVSAAMPSAPAVQCGKGATLLAGATSCSCIDSANATLNTTTNTCSCNDTNAWFSKNSSLCTCKVGFTGTPGSCSSIFQSAATLTAANSASPSISQQIATAITNLTPAAGVTPTTGQTNALANVIATSIQYGAYNQCLTLYPMPQTTAQATSYSACITSANTAIAPYSAANIVTALAVNPITAAAISTYTTTANAAVSAAMPSAPASQQSSSTTGGTAGTASSSSGGTPASSSSSGAAAGAASTTPPASTSGSTSTSASITVKNSPNSSGPVTIQTSCTASSSEKLTTYTIAVGASTQINLYGKCSAANATIMTVVGTTPAVTQKIDPTLNQGYLVNVNNGVTSFSPILLASGASSAATSSGISATVNVTNSTAGSVTIATQCTNSTTGAITSKSYTIANNATTPIKLYGACTTGTTMSVGSVSITIDPTQSYWFTGSSFVTSVPVPCTAGTYSASGSSPCSPCAAGTYTASPSATSCTACSAGTSSSASGATSAMTCVPCLAGSYAAAGSSSCTSCPSGTVAAGDAASCAPCPTGTIASPDQSTCLIQFSVANKLPKAGSQSGWNNIHVQVQCSNSSPIDQIVAQGSPAQQMTVPITCSNPSLKLVGVFMATQVGGKWTSTVSEIDTITVINGTMPILAGATYTIVQQGSDYKISKQ